MVDALPYYDPEPTDEERDAVDDIIAKMIPPNLPLHPSSTTSPEWHPKSDLIQQELDRIQRREPLKAIDLSRYEDVEPPATESLQDWRDTMNRNVIASEAMQSRSDNLSLIKTLGSNAWTMHVYQLEYALKQVEEELLHIQSRTEKINVDRKRAQLEAGAMLTQLSERWRHLLSSNLEVSVACAVLDREIQDLEST